MTVNSLQHLQNQLDRSSSVIYINESNSHQYKSPRSFIAAQKQGLYYNKIHSA